MKNIFFLFFFLISPILLSAQNDGYKKYKKSHFKHLNWGDRQYNNNLRGIKSLMVDLESNDPVLFNILNPEYQIFKSKRKKGRIIIWSSVLVGGVLSWKSFIAFLDQSVPREDPTADNYLIAAFIVGGGGIIIGNKIKPSSRRFVYDITQQFNQHSQGDKVIFAIQPKVNLGNNSSLGLTCSLNF